MKKDLIKGSEGTDWLGLDLVKYQFLHGSSPPVVAAAAPYCGPQTGCEGADSTDMRLSITISFLHQQQQQYRRLKRCDRNDSHKMKERRKTSFLRRYVGTVPTLLPLLLLLFLLSLPDAYAHTQDPYRTLGVSPSSTMQEITKEYRSKCLRYHPDKNRHKSNREKAKCEKLFKEVQNAYHLIGTPEAKRKYDNFGTAGSGIPSFTRSSSGYSASAPYGTDPVAQAFFHANSFFSAPRYQYGRSQYGSSGRFSMQNPFAADGRFASTAAGMGFKSIYVQKVQVPLEDLYKGVSRFQFHLVDNLWNRCRAAIRGKVMMISVYQGFLYALPILRASKVCAIVMAFVIAHATLPKPNPSAKYESPLRPGLKGGQTKIKFASTSFMTPEVIFEIQEGPHKLYKRVDNDLQTEITITPDQALNGCIKRIPSIDEKSSIEVKIKGGVNDGDTIRIVGKGWPIKNAENVFLYGDMIVLIRVQKSRHRRSRRRNKSDSKN
eukprot:scaffold871_cov130-Cylindrotheca_fusiformis.AAC.34